MPESQLSRRTLPPPYSLHRSVSNPDFSDNIDMNLAYGELHYPPAPAIEQEQELQATMSKLDAILTEAQCLQHSATAIISNLQANPEAMAAVALTLAELSNLLTKMSPGILTALKTSSPAIFALLASPQFLIAGGVAIGVTVVMFGGYKIIKNIQANKREANRMEEALVYDGLEMGSIESWRRGIMDVEGESVGTSVDGEFITPEAARRKKEHIRERAREERKHAKSRKAESVASESTIRRVGSESTIRRVGSESTIRQSDIPIRSSSSKSLPAPSENGKSERSSRKGSKAPSESGRSERSSRRESKAPSESSRSERSSRKESKGKEVILIKDKEKKSPLSVFLKKHKEKGKAKEGSEKSRSRSHRPRMIEM